MGRFFWRFFTAVGGLYSFAKGEISGRFLSPTKLGIGTFFGKLNTVFFKFAAGEQMGRCCYASSLGSVLVLLHFCFDFFDFADWFLIVQNFFCNFDCCKKKRSLKKSIEVKKSR